MRKDKSEEMRPEYRREDLGRGVRCNYWEDYRGGINVVLLSPEVAKVFTSEELVNEALRNLIEVAQKSFGPTKRPRSRKAG